MSPVLPPIVDGVWRLNSSSLSNILACPRKGWFQHCLKRVSAFSDPSMKFGTALHAAMEIRYRRDGAAACSQETRQMQDLAIDALYPPDNLQSPPEDEDSAWLCGGRAKEVIAHWNAEFGREPFEVLETERGVELPLGEIYDDPVAWCGSCNKAVATWETIESGQSYRTCSLCENTVHKIKLHLAGRLDALVRYNGVPMVHDYKSTKWQRGNGERWRMSPQFRAYCLLASSLGHGPVRDYWIDSLVVLKPLRKKTATSRPDNSFSRDQFHVTDNDLEEFKRETLLHAETFLRYAVAGAPPRNLNSCNIYRPCQFLPVCSCPSLESGLAWLGGGNYTEDCHNPLST